MWGWMLCSQAWGRTHGTAVNRQPRSHVWVLKVLVTPCRPVPHWCDSSNHWGSFSRYNLC
jgi:hypothetical protein